MDVTVTYSLSHKINKFRLDHIVNGTQILCTYKKVMLQVILTHGACQGGMHKHQMKTVEQSKNWRVIVM